MLALRSWLEEAFLVERSPRFILLALNVGSVEFLAVMRVMRVLRILRVLKLAKVAAQRFHEREARGAARMDLQIYLIAFFCALTIWSTLAIGEALHVSLFGGKAKAAPSCPQCGAPTNAPAARAGGEATAAAQV